MSSSDAYYNPGSKFIADRFLFRNEVERRIGSNLSILKMFYNPQTRIHTFVVIDSSEKHREAAGLVASWEKLNSGLESASGGMTVLKGAMSFADQAEDVVAFSSKLLGVVGNGLALYGFIDDINNGVPWGRATAGLILSPIPGGHALALSTHLEQFGFICKIQGNASGGVHSGDVVLGIQEEYQVALEALYSGNWSSDGTIYGNSGALDYGIYKDHDSLDGLSNFLPQQAGTDGPGYSESESIIDSWTDKTLGGGSAGDDIFQPSYAGGLVTGLGEYITGFENHTAISNELSRMLASNESDILSISNANFIEGLNELAFASAAVSKHYTSWDALNESMGVMSTSQAEAIGDAAYAEAAKKARDHSGLSGVIADGYAEMKGRKAARDKTGGKSSKSSAKPIVLDLDGDGVELVDFSASTAFFDINGDGYRNLMGWVGADDGFLALDKDGDGVIDEHDELSFTSYVDGATTDIEGLRFFDTHHSDGTEGADGILDAANEQWRLAA